MNIRNRLPLVAVVVLSVALMVYEMVRALSVGFTHDESSTFLDFVATPVSDLFFDPANWRTANNHLLNSLCMQVGYHFFGAREWALRWGSVAGGALFLVYALRSVRLWVPASAWLFFGAFCLFALNPYLTEFFSLCRGYGLCVALEVVSLYYFFRWADREHSLDLFKSACALSLGILANFTLLDYLAAFFATVAVVCFVKKYALVHYARLLLLIILPVVATGLLIVLPMHWIRANGEFEWGPDAFWETWRVLVLQFAYNPLPDAQWPKVVILVVATMAFVWMGGRIFRRYRAGGIAANPALFYATLLTLLTMGATAAQHYLLGANYLISRTAVLFYPLLSYVVVLFLLDLRSKHQWAPSIWIVLVSGMALNFLCAANFRYCREWPYDENTRDAVLYANQQGSALRKIRYGVSWKFCPATLFYQKTRSLDHIELVEYDNSHDDVAWVTNQAFDLIYLMVEFEPKVTGQYIGEKRFPRGVLMRRK